MSKLFSDKMFCGTNTIPYGFDTSKPKSKNSLSKITELRRFIGQAKIASNMDLAFCLNRFEGFLHLSAGLFQEPLDHYTLWPFLIAQPRVCWLR